MKSMFEYNWQVRNEWFSWCEEVPKEELLKERIGGVGGILKTLYHIIDVEYSWICEMQGQIPKKQEFHAPFESWATLEKMKDLSNLYHQKVIDFVLAWDPKMEQEYITEQNADGEIEIFKFGEIMRHVIAHEIHHIGQLSVWSRELGKKPVTANLIRRGLF
ncbi:DinB family protein [Ornithinibacillus sp. 179-J 7C1 HS]|uniref:DinB family protein n=1 Tax=Ornithinibacillus sp. 179-J 7C1 HS TaxID=3142384 RepID=UPI0039A30EA7